MKTLDSNIETNKRDIFIENKSDRIQRIDQYNGAYDPLHYVLPFIKGKFEFLF